MKTDHQQVDFVFMNKMNNGIDFFPVEQVGRNLYALFRRLLSRHGLKVCVELAAIFRKFLKDRGIAGEPVGPCTPEVPLPP